MRAVVNIITQNYAATELSCNRHSAACPSVSRFLSPNANQPGANKNLVIDESRGPIVSIFNVEQVRTWDWKVYL